ncbi:MAG: hypothetical protein JRH20_30360, partial [Deltaproteobacteria bacterium]|nr:hypothetical protein [Deltaproteobacteria bacterium]
MMHTFLKMVLASALVVSTGACGTERDPVGGKPVGPGGGEVSTLDGKAALVVPSGALQGEVSVRVAPAEYQVVATWVVDGTAITIEPAGVEFSKPVRLTMRYAAPDAVVNRDWWRVAGVSAEGKPLPTHLLTHDIAAGVLTVEIVSTGTYVVADLKLSSALQETREQKINKVDVLVVIDNSGSMAHEQRNLADNFPRLMDELNTAGLDYRVGVVTTDLGAGNYGSAIPTCETAGGDGGRLQQHAQSPGCTAPQDPWISYNGVVSNIPGCVGDGAECAQQAFSCIARLGIEGCGFESTLESMRRALDPASHANPGFLRPDAALAVLVITDEDDCSAAKPQLYDPAQQSQTDPLGPLTSFRCFEFGFTCECSGQECARQVLGERNNCKPSGDYLYSIDRYADLFAALKPPGRVLFSAVAGPLGPVSVG